MKFYMLIGPTGCGKTTYRKQHLADIPCVSPDDFIVGRWTSEKAKLAWMHAENMAAQLMQEGEDLVVDAQFINQSTRNAWMTHARSFKYEIYGICFKTPYDQLLKNHETRGSRGNYGCVPLKVIGHSSRSFDHQMNDMSNFNGFDDLKVIKWEDINEEKLHNL
jgi:predicted kinase